MKRAPGKENRENTRNLSCSFSFAPANVKIFCNRTVISSFNYTIHKLHHFTGHQGPIYALETSGEKNFFFSGSSDNYVTRWDASGNTQPEAVIRAQATVYSLCFVKEKNFLVIGESSGTFHVIDLNSKKEIHNIVFHKEIGRAHV